MKTKVVVTLMTAPLAVALTACGSGRSPTAAATAARPAASATSSSPSMLTCSTVFSDGEVASTIISILVQDQDSQNKSLSQNWVDALSGDPTNQGQDLQTAMTEFGPYADDAGQLAADAASFDSDASTFLSDESGGLMPGWPSEYKSVEDDIHNLAAACGMKMPVPSNYIG